MTLDELKKKVVEIQDFTVEPGSPVHEALGRTAIVALVFDDGKVFVGGHTMPVVDYAHGLAFTLAIDKAMGEAYEAATIAEAYANPLTTEGRPVDGASIGPSDLLDDEYDPSN